MKMLTSDNIKAFTSAAAGVVGLGLWSVNTAAVANVSLTAGVGAIAVGLWGVSVGSDAIFRITLKSPRAGINGAMVGFSLTAITLTALYENYIFVSEPDTGATIQLKGYCEGVSFNDNIITLPNGCQFTTAPEPAPAL